MSKFYILANLKMNKSFDQSVKYLESLSKKVTNYDDEIILFPSNISLEYFSRNIGKFKLGIQDLDFRNEGQGTGSIAASQVKNLCDYSLIGHSERRQHFFENDEIISRKINISQKNNITPVLCVGEDLDTRNKGFSEVEKFISNQINKAISEETDIRNIMIAYEPIWAIGTGKSASIIDIEEVILIIKNCLEKISKQFIVPIFYGGSVSEKNSEEFRKSKKINGILVGSASLDSEILSKIINYG